MFWYVIYMNFDCGYDFIKLLNQDKENFAFIPKVEKWFGCKSIHTYLPIDLYPHYLFVKSSLNEEEFLKKYKELLESLSRFGKVIEQGDVIVLNKFEQELLSQLFQEQDTIRHSVGNIINKTLIVDEGPLIGLEKYVKKVNRHKRFVLLDFGLFDSMMKLPMEIITKT